MSPPLVESTYDIIKERTAYVPENYIDSRVREVGTASAIDPQQIFSHIKKYQPSPIWRIYAEAKKFYTPKPIAVRIYGDEDLFFAENENLAVCGTGDTPKSALQDLCLHIIHFFEYYKKLNNSKLIGDALRLKELYQDLLVEE